MANKLNPTVLSWQALCKIFSKWRFAVTRKELKSIQISVSSSPSNSILKGRFDGSRKKKWSLVRKPTTNTLRQRAPYYTGWWWRGKILLDWDLEACFYLHTTGFHQFY